MNIECENERVDFVALNPTKARRKGGDAVVESEKPNQPLGVNVLEWYHPIVSIRQQKNTKGLATRLNKQVPFECCNVIVRDGPSVSETSEGIFDAAEKI